MGESMYGVYGSNSEDTLSLAELETYRLLMAYRVSVGLSEVPLSKALNAAAGRHAIDAIEGLRGYAGHTWSIKAQDGASLDGSLYIPQGLGTGFPVGNQYQSFEIGAGYRGLYVSPDITASGAVSGWTDQVNHPDHHAIVVNPGWTSAGVGMYKGAAFTLFSGTTDSTGVPDIVGTSGNDAATLTSFGDIAIAYEGNDTLSGAGGNDVLYGNQGEDALFGDAGNDTLFGGQGADLVFGGDGNDALYGNMMNDIVYAFLGDDSVFGGQGDDAIYGEAGNDVLAGNLGNDTLNGGTGADTFAFGGNSGADVVADFNAGEGDRLSLSGQTWMLGSAADGSALLTLSGGGTVTLAGIAPATVNAGWIAG